MSAENIGKTVDRKLSSWKEIAGFIGRDESTAKRWERNRGMPVRRVPGAGRGSVFAYAEEIEVWMRGTDPASPSGLSLGSDVSVTTREARWRVLSVSLLAVLVIAATAMVTVEKLKKPGMTASPARVGHSPDPTASALYRAGLHAWQTRTPSGLSRAVTDFTSAIARDPSYAQAYAGLADTYNLLGEYTALPPEQIYPKAAVAARRALALDPSLASAHAALAFVDFFWARDAVEAEREFKRSLGLDPQNATAHHWYATYLLANGQYGAALTEIDSAEALDSESSAIPADKGLILFCAGKTEDAVKLLSQLEIDQPAFASPHRYLATIWLAGGNDGAYLHELRLAAQARGDDEAEALAQAGANGLARDGHTGMLHAILAGQTVSYATGKTSAYSLAATYAELGDRIGAMKYLNISIARREPENVSLKMDPRFVALRTDDSFGQLLADAGVQ